MLQKKLMMNGIWARPMTQAAIEIGVFHWNPLRPQTFSPARVQPWPPSYQRRGMARIPCRDNGKKKMVMQKSDGPKSTFPQKSVIRRPVALGKQKKISGE